MTSTENRLLPVIPDWIPLRLIRPQRCSAIGGKTSSLHGPLCDGQSRRSVLYDRNPFRFGGIGKRTSRKHRFDRSLQHCPGTPEDEIIVVQESEYTGAGKHHQAQLSFARENGIDIFFGNPREEILELNITYR